MSTMTIEESFQAKAPREAVYAFLRDPEKCFPCLPGATYGQTYEDGRFDGKITVQVGPLKVSYDGWARYDSEDPEAGTLVMSGQGREKGGGGIVKMSMTCTVTEEGGVSTASVVAEVGLAGRLVRFGRGLVQGVSAEVFREFADRARAQLEAEGAAAAPAAAPADPFGGAADAPADPFGGAAPPPSAVTTQEMESSTVPAASVAAPAQTPAPPPPAKPANGLVLLFRALWRMIFGAPKAG